MSTSRAVLLKRLRKGGHFALVAAVENGTLSAYSAAEEVGFVTRKEPTGRGSQNMARSRAFAIRNALRAYDGLPEEAKPLAQPEEEVRREDTVKTVAGGVGPLPCMLCNDPRAALARQEICDAYMAFQLGDGGRRPAPNGTLPRTCCRRNAIGALSAAALIG